MIKIGTVIQALKDIEQLRKGNTYRIVDLCDDAFYVRYGKDIMPFNKADLLTFFKIIPDYLCPTCLSDAKMIGKEECSYCIHVG